MESISGIQVAIIALLDREVDEKDIQTHDMHHAKNAIYRHCI